jgi:WD and tetratricopeptide repeats protein 1
LRWIFLEKNLFPSPQIKAHFRLARALLELNHVDEANACLEELKRRFPDYAKNHGVMMLKKDITMEQQQRNKKEERPPRSSEFSDSELQWRRLAKDYKDRFVGHCNSKTDIKEANFMGQDGNYIIAG